MTTQNIVQGRLTLSSYVKLFVIGSVGMLPIIIAFNLIMFLIDDSRGITLPGDTNNIPATAFWPLYLMKFMTEIFEVLISGFITGLCSYPFYSWLCSKRNGIILKGKFGVML